MTKKRYNFPVAAVSPSLDDYVEVNDGDNPTRKSGYVHINEVINSPLNHYRGMMFKLYRHFYTKWLLTRRYKPDCSYTIFIASGKRIDTKVDEINRRLTKTESNITQHNE